MKTVVFGILKIENSVDYDKKFIVDNTSQRSSLFIPKTEI